MSNHLAKPLFIALLIGISTSVFAQNVGINTTGAAPSANAILDLNTGNSNNLGLIIPNVTLGASLSTFTPPIAHAATAGDKGMMVYNSSSANQPVGYYCWSGTSWTASGGGNLAFTAKDSSLQSTTSSTYQNAVTLTVSPGTYIITFSAELANNHYVDEDPPKGTWYKFTDGTHIFGNSVITSGDNAGFYIPVSLTTTMTFTSSSTLYLQYMEFANNTYLAYIKNAVIVAIKIS